MSTISFEDFLFKSSKTFDWVEKFKSDEENSPANVGFVVRNFFKRWPSVKVKNLPNLLIIKEGVKKFLDLQHLYYIFGSIVFILIELTI